MINEIFQAYADEVRRLAASATATEPSYYPAIKALLSKMLGHENLRGEHEHVTPTAEGRNHPQLVFALHCEELRVRCQGLVEVFAVESHMSTVNGSVVTESSTASVPPDSDRS